MRRERRLPRLVAALLLSLLAHVAALVLLRGGERAPRPAPPASIELEIVHLSPAPEGGPKDAAQADARNAVAADGVEGAHGKPPPDAAAEATPPVQHTERAAPSADPGVSDDPMERAERARQGPGTAAAAESADEAQGNAPSLPRRLDLLPDRYDLAAAAPPPAPVDPARDRQQAPRAGQAPGAPPAGAGLAALLADDRAVTRATTRLHDHWADLRRRLEADWEVDDELLRDGPRRGIGLKIDDAFDAWREQASRYAATGNPYGDDPNAPGTMRPLHGALPSTLPEPNPLPENDDSFFRRHRTALVLVEQDTSGALREVRLHRSSGSAAYDRHALARARALRELDLAPPPDGSKSLWAFDATLIITPPLPIAGCAVDAYFIPQHCFYPLSERVKSGVRLVGVWMADEEPGRF